MRSVSHISASTRPISMLLVLILFSFTSLIHSNQRTVDCCMVSSSFPSRKVKSSDVSNDDTSHPLLLLSLAFQTLLPPREECKCYRIDLFDCCLFQPASHPVDLLFLSISAISNSPLASLRPSFLPSFFGFFLLLPPVTPSFLRLPSIPFHPSIPLLLCCCFHSLLLPFGYN